MGFYNRDFIQKNGNRKIPFHFPAFDTIQVLTIINDHTKRTHSCRHGFLSSISSTGEGLSYIISEHRLRHGQAVRQRI